MQITYNDSICQSDILGPNGPEVATVNLDRDWDSGRYICRECSNAQLRAGE